MNPTSYLPCGPAKLEVLDIKHIDGMLLDAAVAIASGAIIEPASYHAAGKTRWYPAVRFTPTEDYTLELGNYQPTEEWALCAELLDLAPINVGGRVISTFFVSNDNKFVGPYKGSTKKEAICRCFVAYKLGADNIELPRWLIKYADAHHAALCTDVVV